MKNFLRKLFGRERDAHPFCSAVVAAAGGSSRMGGVNKLLLPLEGIPVLARTLRALDEARLVDEIVVAAREEDLLTIGDLCRTYGVTKPVKIVCGGETRAASVLAAAMECREDPMAVADALFSPAELDQLGGQALRFMGLVMDPPQKAEGSVEEEPPKDAGLETVKN